MKDSTDLKPAAQSQIILSAMGIIICNLALLAGYHLDQGQITTLMGGIANIAGAGYVIWRRCNVSTRISGLWRVKQP